MILILYEKQDASALKTAEWIQFLSPQTELVLMNEENYINSVEIDLQNNNIILNVNQVGTVNLKRIKSFWYRRGDFYLNFNVGGLQLDDNEHSFLSDEWDAIKKYIFYYLESNSRNFCSYFKTDINKLHVLHVAQGVGLLTPLSFVTSSKNVLEDFCERFPTITKSANDVLRFQRKEYVEYTLSSLVEIKDVHQMNDSFFPSYVQQYIHKKYEVRTFIFDRKIWSMAIFSQDNKKTQVDYRNYDSKVPNRYVPYILPTSVERKILDLFSILQLNSGSVDFVVDRNDSFYFLEINPDGQFDWVSEYCNYYIERNIAEILLSNYQ